MVQAGIRKIYYFPAADWEIDWGIVAGHSRVSLSSNQETSSHSNTLSVSIPSESQGTPLERQEKNRRSVMRLIQNNPIALTLYIPQWVHPELSSESEDFIAEKYTVPREWGWELDQQIGRSPSISGRWPTIQAKFTKTVLALYILESRYTGQMRRLRNGVEIDQEFVNPVFRHAMVMAHIAAKRTDDPKVGVGAVLLDETSRYISVGWNGYPKKSQHLDYPHAGADDCVEDEELKYDYILHAEQNALLWRNPTGARLMPGNVLVSTKMPCDECSPVMSDCGVESVVTIRQIPKANDDPARLRGLTYEKLSRLVKDIRIFA